MIAGTVWRVFLLLLLALGHTGFWLACFNRVNATGISRRTIKRTEKFLILFWFLIPITIAIFHATSVFSWLAGDRHLRELPTWLLIYGAFCFAFVAVVGPLWSMTRIPIRFPPKRLIESKLYRWNGAMEIGDSIFIGRLFRMFARVPLNQIGRIELSIKRIHCPQLSKLPRPLKLAHISDLHLTGKMANSYYTFALRQIMIHQPDLIILSGDIIDYDHMLPQVEPILSQMHAPAGCYFLLGNHDRRLTDPNAFRDLMVRLGWHDLGQHSTYADLENGRLFLVGNERPWFPHSHDAWSESGESTQRVDWKLHIAVAHSPDQFGWAVDLNADLMLCGHTHGGQVRFPLIGPVVAPSWHGSRYASGVFLRKETVMHVSRGLSGVHPVRFWCMPEVSILELSGEQPNEPNQNVSG